MAEKDETKVRGAPEVPDHLTKDLEDDDTQETKSSEKIELAESEDTPFEDAQTDEAVDDIAKTESDELLAAQDEATAKTAPKERKRRWYKSGRFWRWTLAVLVLAAGAVFAVESSRHWVLNAFGVRVSASVIVFDSGTGQPLKNVNVSIAQSTAKTDGEGRAKVDQLKLGKQVLRLERAAFAPQTHNVTLGLGSNPLGTYKLKATGAQYKAQVIDFLSGKPVPGAEASNAEAAAVADQNGQIVLTLEDTTGDRAMVKVSAPGYRTEEATLFLEAPEPTKVVLVPSTKVVFVSKESGRYDVYSVDIDGNNKKVLLPATGLETGNITLASSPDGKQVAMASTRDNVRAADGMLLTTLTLVDVETGNTVAIDRGEQLQILDWVDNRVVYHMVVNGQGTESPNRQRIVSYDYKTNSRAQLASANQIRSAASAQGKVYFTDGTNYYSINPDGTSSQNILSKAVWSSYRTDYDTLTLQTENAWYKVTLSNGAVTDIPEPIEYTNKIFQTNTKGDQSLWVEKGTLHLYTIAGAKDAVLRTQSGLMHPVRWLTNTDFVYRVTSSQETADYVMSSQGGEPRKLTNVNGTFGPVQSY